MFQAPWDVKAAHKPRQPSLVVTCRAGFFNLCTHKMKVYANYVQIICSPISISPVLFMTHYFVSSYFCCILVLWYTFSIHLFSCHSKLSHDNDFQFHLPLCAYCLSIFYKSNLRMGIGNLQPLVCSMAAILCDNNYEKINSWVSFGFLHGYRAPLGGPSGRRSSAIIVTNALRKVKIDFCQKAKTCVITVPVFELRPVEYHPF